MKILDRFPDIPDWLDAGRPGTRPPLVIFTHVPKAAGTSFTAYLGQIYGRHLGLRYPRWATPIAAAPLEEMTADTAGALHAFASHDDWGVHRRFGAASAAARAAFAQREILYVTLLRDPVERLYSEYRFIRARPGNPRHEAVKALSFDAFVAAARDRQKTAGGKLNLMCRFLTGQRDAGFAEACAALERNYAAVAPMQKTDRLIDHLRDRLGWPDTAVYERRNQTSATVSVLPDDLRPWQESPVFEDDRRLFDHVRQTGLVTGRSMVPA